MKSASRRPVLVIALAAVLTGVTLCAQTASEPSSRFDRLEAWFEAVEHHTPGELDEPAVQIGKWSPENMRLVWIDVGSLVLLIRDPGVALFYISETGGPDRQQVFYSPSQLRLLRTLAQRITDRGGQGAENLLLKRGAMMHADIAMLATIEGHPSSSSAPGLQRTMLYMRDGQQIGLEYAVSHFEMGRRLLDKVRAEGRVLPNKVVADPRGDPGVCLWYLATGAYMQSAMKLDVLHVDKSLETCPMDADVSFFAAALHETMAGPRRQATFRSFTVPRGVTFRVEPAGVELRKAEGLYRRALELNPRMTEARIRLGRVLGQRGRHDEAATHLRQALATSTEPLLEYYAALFLGAEAEALGNDEEARQSYQRAVSLVPTAQSPLLGLSRLALNAGNRATAGDVIRRVLTLPPDGDERVDPWWIYETVQARNVEMLFARLHRAF